MNDMAITYSCEFEVYDSHIDENGHLGYRHFFEYVDNARQKLQQQSGFTNNVLRDLGCLLFVRDINAKHFDEVSRGEVLVVRPSVAKVRYVSFALEYDFFVGNNHVYQCRQRIGCVDIETRRPKQLPENLKETLEQLVKLKQPLKPEKTRLFLVKQP